MTSKSQTREPEYVLQVPGRTRMLDVIRRNLQWATRLQIAVSFTRCSGLSLIYDDLRLFLSRGGTAEILSSSYLHISEPQAFRSLLTLGGAELWVHDGAHPFHTKLFAFEASNRSEVWIGSSNISRGGISTNVEWNLCAHDPETARHASRDFEHLLLRTDVNRLSPEWVEEYSERWRPPTSVQSFPRVSEDRPISPNPAQLEALAALSDARERGERSAAVIMATGTGKTYLAALDSLGAKCQSVLYLSHRLDHLHQSRRAFRHVFGPDRSYGICGGGAHETGADLVFASVQSARSQLATELIRRDWDYVVVDEFHHAAARTYQAILEKLNRKFLLGITATPERSDGADILGYCNYNVPYELRIHQAINRGWLLPFHYFGIADSLVDYDPIPWRSGGFEPAALENALVVEDRACQILTHAREKGFDGEARVGIGFCAGVRHARYMADYFTEHGERASAITADSHEPMERLPIYERLQDPRDELRWLFVADILNEGVDIPAVNTLLMLRPTQSVGLFLQQLGRGLRLTPDCEVLTVLDFVGNHRSSWLAIDALVDPHAAASERTVTDLGITPPEGCEIVLETKTIEILDRMRRLPTKRQACLDEYRRLRDELGRPVWPRDFWGREDVSDWRKFPTRLRPWVHCRVEANDASDWEQDLAEDSALFRLLQAAEADWQEQRVHAYALLWGMCESPTEPDSGYERFFQKFPHWRCEYARLDETNAWSRIQKKVPDCQSMDNLWRELSGSIPSECLLDEIEGRLLYTLAADYKKRHAGVLRTPADLVVERAKYTRNEIVNHFGVQYDPARHNTGVLKFGADIALITKLDTSSAKSIHQYSNRFESRELFRWDSQNRMSRTNEAGLAIIDSRARGNRLHLFVQPRSHAPAIYLGVVVCEEAVGDNPFRATLKLPQEMSSATAGEFGVDV